MLNRPTNPRTLSSPTTCAKANKVPAVVKPGSLDPSGNPDVFKVVSLVLGSPEFQRQKLDEEKEPAGSPLFNKRLLAGFGLSQTT